MIKKQSAPFTLEEDIARLSALLPTEVMIEEFGGMLQQIHRSDATERERLLALGMCHGYLSGLKSAELLSAAKVPDLREIVFWAELRSEPN
ncbi:hypothetical protein K3169_04885 [Pseudomonas phytophila]|uniref:Uncharacterized protein n=1 Tax=Pseudomonas phytophila TaxID=2867264 RepID=A0ABY6FH40_9PSED|nr:hypothetical protein [Pseudomonas phytophila]UXZ97245.1 hypothetical protein K3169_04885 [Pseudomonas phytophila]